MILGLIADTHNLLDPRVGIRFAKVDHILHAGDVCRPSLIAELEAIAPVTVIAGNNDDHLGWREAEIVELGNRRILIQHIVTPGTPTPTEQKRIKKAAIDVVVFGHTHRPYCRKHGEVLFLNPGSAGAPRFGLPQSIALLHITTDALRAEFLDLDGRPLPL